MALPAWSGAGQDLPSCAPAAETEGGRCKFLHKLTTRLVRENQTVVIEDLTVRNMLKNRSPARAVSDASWSEMRSMLEYKADWYGRDLVVVDRWFPSRSAHAQRLNREAEENPRR